MNKVRVNLFVAEEPPRRSHQVGEGEVELTRVPCVGEVIALRSEGFLDVKWVCHKPFDENWDAEVWCTFEPAIPRFQMIPTP